LVHANNRTAFIGDQVTPIIGIRWLDLWKIIGPYLTKNK
jgi:hypothetical protein